MSPHRFFAEFTPKSFGAQNARGWGMRSSAFSLKFQALTPDFQISKNSMNGMEKQEDFGVFSEFEENC
jgi:hypothetical protein